MKNVDFYNKIDEVLELGEKAINNRTRLNLTSLRTLTLIAFIDENFNKRVKVVDLKNVKTISDLMNLIGKEYFTD